MRIEDLETSASHMDDSIFPAWRWQGKGRVWPFCRSIESWEEWLVHRTHLGCLCSASKHAENQDSGSKAQKYKEGEESFRVLSLSSTVPAAACLPVTCACERKGRMGVSVVVLFVTQKVRGKSMVDQIYNASSEMESFHFGSGKKKRISQYRLYAKDAWVYLSLCINGVGERIAFHIHNCFYFWFLLQSWRFTVCNTTCVGFTGQSTCPGGNKISCVVSHSHLLLVFFTGTETHNELNTEHQPQLGEARHDHFSHGNNFGRIWLECTV